MTLEAKIKEQLDKRDEQGVSNEYRAIEIAEALRHIKSKGNYEGGIVGGILGVILF